MSTRTRASRNAATLHHVVALDLGGGGYFLYSDVGFTTSDGIVIRPGLNAPDVVASLEGGGDSVGLSILSPETWAALVRGLDGAAAELSELAEGDSWGQRTSLMRGYLDSPTYGSAEEDVSASLASFVWEDSGQIPRPTWKIGPETWPRFLLCARVPLRPARPLLSRGARLPGDSAQRSGRPGLVPHSRPDRGD